MRITEILSSGRPSVSFEVFPPKRSEPSLFDDEAAKAAMESTKRVVAEIAATRPAFMSVTYGAAGGTTGANTCEIASFVKNECAVPALAHLTSINSSRDLIADEITAFRRAGIENILCLRGDYPAGCERKSSPGGFNHAVDLVRALRPSNFCLGGACYPECHPECEHIGEDIAHLKEKVDAGLDFLTTQMFFDNNLLYNFLYKIREAGITVPVIPGVMPITRANQLERAIKLSGSFVPQRFKSLVDKFGHDPLAMKQAGIAYATDQIIDLFANGIKNVHVYSMNNPDVAEKIMSNLSDILGK